MDRLLMERLIQWKLSPRRKPLILTGARQVGKTWLLKEFGRLHFQNVVYLNLELNPSLSAAFEGDFDISLLVRTLSAAASEPINPETTLVILDEIQQCLRALTSLKYFCEEAPEYAVVAAGSLLGLTKPARTGNAHITVVQRHAVKDTRQKLSLVHKKGIAQTLNKFKLLKARIHKNLHRSAPRPACLPDSVDPSEPLKPPT